jgi:hypothetical protein
MKDDHPAQQKPEQVEVDWYQAVKAEDAEEDEEEVRSTMLEEPEEEGEVFQSAQEYWNSLEALAAEHLMATEHGIGWRERGPPPPSEGGPQTWRGGTYRPNAQRWAKRGGRHLDYYNTVYGRKGQQKAKDKGKGKKGKNLGKGKSSGSGSSSSTGKGSGAGLQ